MKFLIRDDDINFFTKPVELESLYADIYDVCPVSLGIVPFQGETVCRAVPQDHWRGNHIFPLGKNIELCEYLIEHIAAGHYHVMLHGYSHKDEADGYEFETGADLPAKAKEGKEYLQDVLQCEVKAFVPPHNSLSRVGAQAVIDAGMNILNAFSHWPWERPFSWKNLLHFFHALRLALTKGKSFRLPYIKHFPYHDELGCYCLVESTDYAELADGLDYAASYGAEAIFAVATHYWELALPGKLDILKQLIVKAERDGWKFVGVNSLWE